MEIDPRFKAARQNAQRRQRRGWVLPAVMGVFVLMLGGGGVGLYLAGYMSIGEPEASDGDLQVDEGALIDNAAAYNSAFADLAGDPMVLRFDTSAAAEKTRKLLRPVDIPAARAGNDLLILTDEMVTSQVALITTLPSSREDFAFFQAQKKAGAAMNLQPIAAPVLAEPVAPTGEVVSGEGLEASWGDSLDGSVEGAEDSSYSKTQIQDTTSLAFLIPESQRVKPYEDIILSLKDSPDLVELMVSKGVDAVAAKAFVDQGKEIVPEIAALKPGHVLALRVANRGGMKVPVQLSLYTRDSYAGSLAINDARQVVRAVDPWVEEDLFSFAGDEVVAEADIGRKYRLLDAFYSAAIRNGVPSAVVAETIVMLSQSYDLEAFAAPGDKMTLVFAPDPGSEGTGPGQVLYAAIKGDGRDMECNVYLVAGSQDYACFGKGGIGEGGGGGGAGGLRSGLQTPVQGVMTSRFGPRMHPILKVAKLHKGVDWAAPIGTPVLAAYEGVIASAGDGQGYGNLIRITHPNGLETRYAHLNAFAPGIKAGVQVKAGTLIGFIGTTGLSTGPHLHFEVYEGGVAVDPLGQGGTVVASGGDGSAVEILVDQIIRVESGGKADAKNPLSSATGLGQFIESTWLRMMKQYRPDLAGSMDRAALLALRNDPTISREMVTALAREGEAYLRARGHSITAGRLYLCHFLGAEGANMVLSAQDEQLVGDVMGGGVISANPFLKGRTIAYVKEWAEVKMHHKGGGGVVVSAPAAVVMPPEVLAYQKVIAGLLATPI